MTVKTLYRFIREGGGVTVSLEKPDVSYTELYRLIADEGKAVTQNGIDLYSVLDVESTEGWYEINEYTTGDEISPEEFQSMIEEVL